MSEQAKINWEETILGLGKLFLKPAIFLAAGILLIVAFGMAQLGSVKLVIYDRQGQIVRELVNDSRSPNIYAEPWDGRNASGKIVASGTYILKLQTADVNQTRKIVVIK